MSKLSAAFVPAMFPRRRRRFYEATVDLLQRGRGDQFKLDGEDAHQAEGLHAQGASVLRCVQNSGSSPSPPVAAAAVAAVSVACRCIRVECGQL